MSGLKPISPEMPRNALVLVWSLAEGFSVASYDTGLARWYAEAAGELAHNYDELVTPNPTHWMLLPEPPK